MKKLLEFLRKKKKMIITGVVIVGVPVLGVIILDLINDDRAVSPEKLPNSIKSFVAENFLGNHISGATIDFLDYTVMLNNNISIEFNTLRKWEQIESDGAEIPQNIIPAQIISALRLKYPQPIRTISKECRGYEIELEGLRQELYFDKKGNLSEIDD